MPTVIVDPFVSTTQVISGVNYESLVVSTGANLITTNQSIHINGGSDYALVKVDGFVRSRYSSAIEIGRSGDLTSHSANNTVMVSETGTVYGHTTAVFARSDNFSLLNEGTVQSATSWIAVTYGEDSVLTNSGVLKGRYGVHLSGNDGFLTNTGLIDVESFGAYVFGRESELINTGTITANRNAVQVQGVGADASNSGQILSSGVGVILASGGGGSFSELRNSGLIQAKDEGVSVLRAALIHNDGEILAGENAIDINLVGNTPGTYSVEIHNSGTISTGGNDTFSAVSVYGAYESRIKLVNSGEVSGNIKFGLSGAGGVDLIVNTGLITGNVNLGDENDVYRGRLGQLEGLLNGGEGADRMYGGVFTDIFYGGEGNDGLYGLGGEDRLYGEEGNDSIYGGAGDDYLDGGADADFIYGGTGEDELFGRDGNDQIYGNAGEDRLLGGDGSDLLYGGVGNDALYGGDDLDYLFGGSGNDDIYAEIGDDIVYGGEGHDTLVGGTGEDSMFGGQGNDLLNGGFDDDRLEGNDGDDVLNGDAGDDTIYGGLGDDTIDGGLDGDSVYGGAGADTITGGDGNDVLRGGAGNDDIAGEAGDDYLSGGLGDDLVDGGEGIDVLLGGDGDDTLNGGRHNDRLTGGLGDDLLIGGSGRDRFIFLGNDGHDVIQDFTDTKDLIDLSAFGLAAGSFATVVNPALSASGGNVVLDLDALGGSGSVTLLGTDLADLTAADFLL